MDTVAICGVGTLHSLIKSALGRLGIYFMSLFNVLGTFFVYLKLLNGNYFGGRDEK